MLAAVDKNADGKLNYEEFIVLFSKWFVYHCVYECWASHIILGSYLFLSFDNNIQVFKASTYIVLVYCLFTLELSKYNCPLINKSLGDNCQVCVHKEASDNIIIVPFKKGFSHSYSNNSIFGWPYHADLSWGWARTELGWAQLKLELNFTFISYLARCLLCQWPTLLESN